MEIISYEIPVKNDGEPTYIAPIGDIQWSGENGPTALTMLNAHLDKCQKLKAWYVGMGDMTDFLSPSNRQRLRAAALYDTAQDVVEDAALRLADEIYTKALKRTNNRWLGYMEGHHFTQLQSGQTTDQYLCHLLNAKFLGTTAFIRLVFAYGKARGNIVMFATHGCGGGAKVHAPIMKLENLSPYFDADIYCIGHMSKQGTAPLQRIYPVWRGNGEPHLMHRKLCLVGCGGFSRSYQLGAKQGSTPRDGYVAQKLMAPAALGAPIIKIIPRWERAGANSGHHWAPEVTVEL